MQVRETARGVLLGPGGGNGIGGVRQRGVLFEDVPASVSGRVQNAEIGAPAILIEPPR